MYSSSHRHRVRHYTLQVALLTSLCLLTGCTGSPLGTDVDSAPLFQLNGKVSLLDGSDPADVYVWLEGSQLSTSTDGSGQFQLQLPKNSPGTTQFVDGVFNLHFYVANYGLATSTVLIKDGEFVRSRGDLNSNGELIGIKSLIRSLNIRVDIDPSTVGASFEGSISVAVSLQALHDSVTVTLPKLFSHSSAAVILDRIGTNDVIVFMPEDSSRVFANEKIGPEVRILDYDFYLEAGMLPEGEYQVVPFMLIERDTLPPGLLSSLGPDVEDIGPGFLKIPFKRQGGLFTVIPDD